MEAVIRILRRKTSKPLTAADLCVLDSLAAYTPFFKHRGLTWQTRAFLYHSIVVVDAPSGSHIVDAGCDTPSVYIVAAGSVHACVGRPGSLAPTSTVSVGQHFPSLSLTSSLLTKSTHTYVVNEQAVLLKISRAVYKRMLLCGRIAACVGRLSALFRSPYLGSWEVDAIRELSERITIRRIAIGDTLLQVGDPLMNAYYISRGSCRLLWPAPGTKDPVSADQVLYQSSHLLVKGDSVGDWWLEKEVGHVVSRRQRVRAVKTRHSQLAAKAALAPCKPGVVRVVTSSPTASPRPASGDVADILGSKVADEEEESFLCEAASDSDDDLPGVGSDHISALPKSVAAADILSFSGLQGGLSRSFSVEFTSPCTVVSAGPEVLECVEIPRLFLARFLAHRPRSVYALERHAQTTLVEGIELGMLCAAGGTSCAAKDIKSTYGPRVESYLGNRSGGAPLSGSPSGSELRAGPAPLRSIDGHSEALAKLSEASDRADVASLGPDLSATGCRSSSNATTPRSIGVSSPLIGKGLRLSSSAVSLRSLEGAGADTGTDTGAGAGGAGFEISDLHGAPGLANRSRSRSPSTRKARLARFSRLHLDLSGNPRVSSSSSPSSRRAAAAAADSARRGAPSPIHLSARSLRSMPSPKDFPSPLRSPPAGSPREWAVRARRYRKVSLAQESSSMPRVVKFSISSAKPPLSPGTDNGLKAGILPDRAYSPIITARNDSSSSSLVDSGDSGGPEVFSPAPTQPPFFPKPSSSVTAGGLVMDAPMTLLSQLISDARQSVDSPSL